MSSGNTVKDGSGDPWWLLIDDDGHLIIVGPSAHDALAAGNPHRVAGVYHAADPTGTDGDVLDLLADAAGRLKIVGAAAENAAVAGNPVQVGGRYDIANRTLNDGDVGGAAMDVAGRLKIVGTAFENAVVSGAPVLMGGRYDATDRTLDNLDVGGIAVDATGRAQVVTNPGGRSIVQLSADGQIKAAPGTLHGLVITSVGVTANDTIIIKDGGAGGTERIRVTLGTDETIRLLGIDAAFATDIYSDETLAGAGTIYVTGIYT